jgi:hypothetical protein
MASRADFLVDLEAALQLGAVETAVDTGKAPGLAIDVDGLASSECRGRAKRECQRAAHQAFSAGCKCAHGFGIAPHL